MGNQQARHEFAQALEKVQGEPLATFDVLRAGFYLQNERAWSKLSPELLFASERPLSEGAAATVAVLGTMAALLSRRGMKTPSALGDWFVEPNQHLWSADESVAPFDILAIAAGQTGPRQDNIGRVFLAFKPFWHGRDAQLVDDMIDVTTGGAGKVRPAILHGLSSMWS